MVCLPAVGILTGLPSLAFPGANVKTACTRRLFAIFRHALGQKSDRKPAPFVPKQKIVNLVLAC
jgi:hypothetical protein